MRKLQTNPFILSLAWLAAFSLVGCGGGGGGGGGGPTGVDVPSDNNSDRLPQESDVSAAGFRALAFTFSETPKQGKPVRIGMTTSGTARNVAWTLVSTPAGANAPFTVDADGLGASLTADLPGRYELKVEANVNGEAAMGSTRFRVREGFSYDREKVHRDSPDATLDTIIGPITNQVFAFSIRSSEALLREILTFYPEFEVLGYDDAEGLLLQFDEEAPDASDVLEELRSEPEIDSVVHRLHEGENAPRILMPPDDGSRFNDGGDNWHLEKIGALEAWDENTGSVNFLVGVADSGFHPTHEDLLGRFASVTLAPSVQKARHGMGVAGAIGARTNNVRGISGINRKSKIVATRYDLFGALDTVRNGRKVLLVNNSWAMAGSYIPGNFQPNNPTHAEPSRAKAIERSRKYRKAAQRKYKDRLIVWAAGNGIGNGGSTSDSDGDGQADHYGVLAIYDNGSVHLNDRGTLARLDNTIVVAALTSNNRLVYYSEYGETVDIAAPTNFKSTSNVTASGSQYYVGPSYGTNTGSGFGGTSAAAPVVTGAASLCFAADSKLTAKEVKKILLETASETATERYTTPTGKTERLAVALPILDMGAAVKAATPPEVEITIDAGAIIENDQVFFDSEIETGLRPYIYEWDFGDGKTSSLPDDTHAYTKGGTYTVTLKVTDACDREATASLQLTVTDTGPDEETPPAREDWVVWYTGNVACWGAPFLYVSHRTGFERQELRSSFRGGGIDPNILVEKTVMQAGFDSREDAMAWICPQISGFYRHYWCGAHYLVGGEPFRFGNVNCDVSNVPEVTP